MMQQFTDKHNCVYPVAMRVNRPAAVFGSGKTLFPINDALCDVYYLVTADHPLNENQVTVHF